MDIVSIAVNTGIVIVGILCFIFGYMVGRDIEKHGDE